MSFTEHQSTCMHLKAIMFVRKLMKMEHSIKFPVIYPCGHVCTQFHIGRIENSTRVAYIYVRANGK